METVCLCVLNPGGSLLDICAWLWVCRNSTLGDDVAEKQSDYFSASWEVIHTRFYTNICVPRENTVMYFGSSFQNHFLIDERAHKTNSAIHVKWFIFIFTFTNHNHSSLSLISYRLKATDHQSSFEPSTIFWEESHQFLAPLLRLRVQTFRFDSDEQSSFIRLYQVIIQFTQCHLRGENGQYTDLPSQWQLIVELVFFGFQEEN